MRNKLLAFVAVLLLIGFVYADPKPRGRASAGSAKAHRLALVDMAHIFKNSTEILDRREALKREIAASDPRAKTGAQRFREKEVKIYKEVYLSVQKFVVEVAHKRGYTMVIRFNREGVADATEPKTILTKLNRLVIYSQKSQDITDEVLKELNRRYDAGK